MYAERSARLAGALDRSGPHTDCVVVTEESAAGAGGRPRHSPGKEGVEDEDVQRTLRRRRLGFGPPVVAAVERRAPTYNTKEIEAFCKGAYSTAPPEEVGDQPEVVAQSIQVQNGVSGQGGDAAGQAAGGRAGKRSSLVLAVADEHASSPALKRLIDDNNRLPASASPYGGFRYIVFDNKGMPMIPTRTARAEGQLGAGGTEQLEGAGSMDAEQLEVGGSEYLEDEGVWAMNFREAYGLFSEGMQQADQSSQETVNMDLGGGLAGEP